MKSEFLILVNQENQEKHQRETKKEIKKMSKEAKWSSSKSTTRGQMGEQTYTRNTVEASCSDITFSRFSAIVKSKVVPFVYSSLLFYPLYWTSSIICKSLSLLYVGSAVREKRKTSK